MPRLPVVAGGPDVQQQAAHQYADHPGRGERALRQGHRLPDRGANRQGFYIPPTTTPTYTAGGTGRGSGVGRPGGPQDRRGGSRAAEAVLGDTAEPGTRGPEGQGWELGREKGRGLGGVGMAGLGRRGGLGGSGGEGVVLIVRGRTREQGLIGSGGGRGCRRLGVAVGETGG